MEREDSWYRDFRKCTVAGILATAVLANFKQVAKDKPVAIHPIVARSVDPEVLEKMRARPADGGNTSVLTEETETKGEA